MDDLIKQVNFNYGVFLINTPKFWEQSINGNNITIAVVDSGCQTDHIELKDNIVDKYNFTTDDNGDIKNVTDYLGHGTHTAGVIAAQNKKGTIGIAPNSKLVILKVIDKKGSGNYRNLIKAINFASDWRGENDEKIDIINLSLGGRNNEPSLRKAIDNALSNNINIVVSAGNYGDGSEATDEILYPGYYQDVIQVSAIDKSLKPTAFSNTNKNIDFLAPGKNIYSTFINGGYLTLSGTSMAAPHVTGAIALLNEFFKTKGIPPTQERVFEYLISNSKILKNYSENTQGNGVIQL